MSDPATQVAREATSKPAFRALARAGFAANGVVHVLLGAIVLAVAFGARGDADQSGAFRAIATAPLGFVVLWVIAAALIALALWRVAEGILVRGGDLSDWGARASAWGQAAVFVALGVVSAAVALGARPNADRAAEDTSRGVLQIPGGVFVLAAVGVGFVGAGIGFAVAGMLRTYRKKMTLPRSGIGRVVDVLGIAGYIGKGAALGIVGVLLVVAAVKGDADAAGGLDGAVDGLIQMPFGPFLAALVGVGLIAYGVFTAIRSRYADL